MKIEQVVRRFISNWDQFWFKSGSIYNLAIMRIVLCGSLGFLYLARHFDVATYYTEEGILPRNLALKIMGEFIRPNFLLASWPDGLTVFLHAFLVFGLFLLAFGIGGRFLMFLIWGLHLSFLQRNFSVAFGADLIGGIFLFLLAGTQCCEQISVMKFFETKSRELKKVDIGTSVFFRLIQIQLVVIYIFTGFEKLKGFSWWDGTALWTVFANSQMASFDLTWFRWVPILVVTINFATVLFETYFPFLILGPARYFTLAFGACLHLGIGFLMALWGFAFVMLSPYVLFFEEKAVKSFLNRLSAGIGRWVKKAVSN